VKQYFISLTSWSAMKAGSPMW